jgi:hypothetical protein
MWQQEFTWFFALFHHEFRQGNRIAFEVLMTLAFAHFFGFLNPKQLADFLDMPHFSTGHFCKSFCNKYFRGGPIVYSLWRAQPIQQEQAGSDTLRRYRAIRDACTPWYPGQPSGPVARPLLTLAALISGIVGSKSPQLPPIAAQGPNGTQPARRVQRCARGVDNAPSLEAGYGLPSADVVLRHLAWQTGGLVRDGSSGGRGGPALMIHGVEKGRALGGLAGAPSPQGALACRAAYRRGPPHPRADPRGDAGRVAGRWRMRWAEAPAHAAAGGLVLRGSHGHASRGDGGGRDLPPGCTRRVSQARQAERVHRGPRDPRGVWAHHGAGLLGQGGARTAVWGQP